MSTIKADTIQNRAGSYSLTTTLINNGPVFYGELASEAAITRNTSTNLTGLTANEVDTDSAFDGTSFTVPSGKGGIYHLFAAAEANFGDIGSDGELMSITIFKTNISGTALAIGELVVTGAAREIVRTTVHCSTIVNLAAADVVTVGVTLTDANGGNAVVNDGVFTNFGGFRLFGVSV